MKYLTKIFAVILAFATVLMMCSCSSNENGKDTEEESETLIERHPKSEEEIAITVNEIGITKSQFDYYYNMAYQYYVRMESSYNQQGVSIGFPLDKAPDEVSTGETDENGKPIYYSDEVAKYAASLAFQQAALYNEAVAAGYSLNADEQAQIDEAIASISEQATTDGCSLDEFIKANYSEGLNEKGLRKLLETELIASRYNDDIQTKAKESITDEMVQAEYNANSAEYADYTGDVVDVRHCLIQFICDDADYVTDEEKMATYQKAVTVLEEFKAAGATEEAFVDIVKKYNDDTASTEAGGLYEGVAANSNYVANFKNWSVDPARKAGDCEIIETEFGYHLMYFVRNNGPEWKFTVREALQEEAYSEMLQKIVGENGKYAMVKNEAVIDKCINEFCDKIREDLNR